MQYIAHTHTICGVLENPLNPFPRQFPLLNIHSIHMCGLHVSFKCINITELWTKAHKFLPPHARHSYFFLECHRRLYKCPFEQMLRRQRGLSVAEQSKADRCDTATLIWNECSGSKWFTTAITPTHYVQTLNLLLTRWGRQPFDINYSYEDYRK